MKLNGYLIVLSLSIGSCAAKNPNWQPRIYVGNPEKSQIERQGGSERLSCGAKEFRDFLCMDQVQLTKLYERCLDDKLELNL